MHFLSYAFIVLGVIQLVTAVNYLIRPQAFFDGWLRDVFRMRGKRMKPYLWLRQGLLAATGLAYIIVNLPSLFGRWYTTFFEVNDFNGYVFTAVPWLFLLLAAEIGAIFALNRYYTGRIVLTK